MDLILDTSGVSAMADGDSSIEALISEASTIVLPVIVLGEFVYGIRQSRYRIRYERWLAELTSGCQVMGIDEGTAIEYAGIREELRRQGRPIPSNDVWIAALARQHGLRLLSRDRHFDWVSRVRRLGW